MEALLSPPSEGCSASATRQQPWNRVPQPVVAAAAQHVAVCVLEGVSGGNTPITRPQNANQHNPIVQKPIYGLREPRHYPEGLTPSRLHGFLTKRVFAIGGCYSPSACS